MTGVFVLRFKFQKMPLSTKKATVSSVVSSSSSSSKTPRYVNNLRSISNLFLCVHLCFFFILSRLYVKARHLGYKRGKHDQHPLVSLLQLEHVTDKRAASWYLGKRVAYVYKAKKALPVKRTTKKDQEEGKKPRMTHTRVIWGHVSKVHGNSGVVRARFDRPLPPRSFGAMCRVMLYPSKI